MQGLLMMSYHLDLRVFVGNKETEKGSWPSLDIQTTFAGPCQPQKEQLASQAASLCQHIPTKTLWGPWEPKDA